MKTGVCEWERLKELGNQLYKNKFYSEAHYDYQAAISELKAQCTNNNVPETADDVLYSLEDCNNMAKLHSNCAVSLYQLALSERDSVLKRKSLQEALEEGQMAVKWDDDFDKGHFRCALCLNALGRKDEVIPHAAKILALYKADGKDYSRDKHLVKILKDSGYFTRTLRSHPQWDKVKFKDNVKVIGPGKDADCHTLESSLISGKSKMTLVLCPGVYRLKSEFIVRSNQEIQVMGDIRRKEDKVTIECLGRVTDSQICHLFHVDGGKLTVADVFLKQSSDHPNLHAVYVENGGEVLITNCLCYSKCSGCLAANENSQITVRKCNFERACGGVIVVGGSTGTVEKCTLSDTAMIGLEARDGAFMTVSDSTLSDGGSQALTVHAGAKGAKIHKCTFTGNSTRFNKQEPSVTCGAGSTTVTNCQFIDNLGGGIMAQDRGQVTVTDSVFRRGRYGLAASMRGEAHMTNNKIIGSTFGLCIIYNQNGKIVLENNVINVKTSAVTLSPDDIGPQMIGTQHDVIVHTDVSSTHMKMGLLMQKMAKMNDHYGETEAYMDPRKVNAQNERICGPCGLAQRSMGTRFMRCSGCKITWYCSKPCQQKDWKLHKEICQKTQDIMKGRL